MTTPLKSKEDRPMKKIAIAFLALAAITACQKEEDFQKEEVPQEEESKVQEIYTLTVEASKGVETKALSLEDEGARLNAYWENGETVAVFLGGTQKGLLQADVDAQNNTRATLSGTLTSVEGIAQDTELKLLFPRPEWDYTGQDGTVETIGTKYDYAMAAVTVDEVNTDTKTITTTTTADFQNQQSVYRFRFKVGDDILGVQELTVSSDHNKLVTSRSYDGGWNSTYGSLTVKAKYDVAEVLYLSLRNENTNTGEPDKFYFYIIDIYRNMWLGEKDIPGDMLGDGKFISAQNISVIRPDLAKSGTATVVW